MGTDRYIYVIDILCEQDMNCIFMLPEIVFQHQVGVNSVTDCMGFMLDCTDYMRYLVVMGYVLRAQSRFNFKDLTVCDLLAYPV